MFTCMHVHVPHAWLVLMEGRKGIGSSRLKLQAVLSAGNRNWVP